VFSEIVVVKVLPFQKVVPLYFQKTGCGMGLRCEDMDMRCGNMGLRCAGLDLRCGSTGLRCAGTGLVHYFKRWRGNKKAF